MTEVKPGKYLHWKGKEYGVIGVARHSETQEEFVVYYDQDRQLWVRPKEMFFEEVERDGYKGPRFKYIEEQK